MRMWKNRRPLLIAPASPERRGFLKRLFAFTAGGAVVAAATPRLAHADGDPWVGELALVPYNFAPRGWAFCDGQLLPISQNQVLFALLGTQYGGDGQVTFGLPDLRGRVPIHVGGSIGAGLSLYHLGEMGGAENVTLLASQMPAHNHLVNVSSLNGASDTPLNMIPARNAAGVPSFTGTAPNGTLGTNAISQAGGNLAHENRQPYLGLNWVIALQGIFPSQF